ncbi:ABC-F family ATP-binding cassette domain-containing protein [Flexithrix dorotheae]|uniref:ABC-F family ATP-binding cassette domain-containing protein n=1 Tax=Flexithrix dorotheae TaxID=70993 RepID=UPI00037FA73C|nr:ABC-F family ATP-binding cassette domain-containing protein [Flexithrix dorotheae]
MNYLSVDSLTKTFGEKVLFENISFGIEKGQKVALVARNGSGKTTLLKIITGQDSADTGEVVINKDISVAFLPQEPAFDNINFVMDYIFQGDNAILKAIKQYEEAIKAYESDPSDKNLDVLNSATSEVDNLNAWDFEVKVKQILDKLKISNLDQDVKLLSGGQKKRVALSRVLIEEPDFLILDEPTNHLDLDMIEWLEEYLSKQNLSLFLVTHDRYFLDRICTEIIEIEDERVYKHKGNYSYYLENKSEREQQMTKEVEKARNLMRKELEWIRRMPKARGTKAKYRVDAFDDLQEKAKGPGKKEGLQLGVNMARMGKKVMEIKGLNKSFGDLRITNDFNYIFKRKERVGIVGKNGVGKSTFLNMLTGKEKPDSGIIDHGETIVFGYYTQAGIKLEDGKRVIDVVTDIAEVIPLADGSNLTASQFLQLFLFPPKTQYSLVSTLSGGEKRRLYLLTILVKNPNFLILDEPTNDLDLLTLNVLEDFLLNFQGCLILVTHDRYFMDKLVDHLFVFEGDGEIRDFNGKYLEYRDMEDEKERLEKLEKEEKKKAPQPKKASGSDSKKKLSYKEQKEFEALEKEIPELELKKEELSAKMNSGEVTDHIALQEISEEIGELMEEIDEKTMRWLELSELA